MGDIMFDYLFKNAKIVDGTGAKAYRADLGVKDGLIAAIAPCLSETSCDKEHTLNADGKCLTPGFIDIHRHGDAAVFRENYGELEIRQGLTTVVNGNCGLSVVPREGKWRSEIETFLIPVTGEIPESAPAGSLTEYQKAAKATNAPLKLEMLIGNGTISASVAGYGDGKLSDEEIRQCHVKMEESLRDGARGVSLGLGYAPECHYDTETMTRLLEPMKGAGVPLITHIRGEGDSLDKALREVIGIAAALRVPLHVSHLKSMGARNWGKGMDGALRILDEGREAGNEVSCDFYPYRGGSTQLIHVFPTTFLADGIPGFIEFLKDPAKRREITAELRKPSDAFENIVELVGWENIRMTTLMNEKNQKYCGMSVTEIAEKRGQDPFDCVYDMLIEENCEISMIDYYASEEDILKAMKYPYSNIISDSIYPTKGILHPRLYGTFPRVIEKYVKKVGALSLEEAVHKMTLAPARVVGLKDRGAVKEGMAADLLLFDPDKIHTGADFANPTVLAEGFDVIMVDGQIRVRNDIMLKQ